MIAYGVDINASKAPFVLPQVIWGSYRFLVFWAGVFEELALELTLDSRDDTQFPCLCSRCFWENWTVSYGLLPRLPKTFDE